MKKKNSYSFKQFFNSRFSLYAMLIVITISFICTYSKVYDVKLDLNGDNIHYYALGKALTEGKGFTNIMYFKETPHTHFPPGYPVFVAGVMKFFPNNINAVKIANGLLLFASILLLFFLLKKLSGSIIIPFLTCIFCSMHAEILRYATIMMSEMLFLFCSICTIYLILTIRPERLFTKQGYRDTLLLLPLLFLNNYIYFVRTMGTSLILAVILYTGILFFKQIIRYFRERKQKPENPNGLQRLLRYGLLFLLLAGSFAGTKVMWDMRNEHVGKTNNDYVHDFLKKPKGEVMATWNDWKERIGNNLITYTNKYIPNAILYTSYDLKVNSTAEVIRGIGVILLLLTALFFLGEKGLLLFLYLGATMAVLLVWPEQYGGLRYFIATIPFLIFLFFYSIQAIFWYIGKRRKKEFPAALPIACIVAIAMFFMFPAYSKALFEKKELAKYKSWSPQIAGNAFTEFTTAMQWCGKNLPDSARMICRKPELYFVYSGGKKCGNFSQYGKPEEILRQLIDQKATHIIIDHWFRHAYVTVYPLISTHYPEKFKFIGKFEQQGKQSNEPPTLIYKFHPEGRKIPSLRSTERN